MPRRPAFSLALILLAGACARSENASVIADINGQTQVEQVREPDADEDQVALGEWRESLQDDAAALEFGPTGAAPLFSMRCDGRRGAFLQRHGAVVSGDLPNMLVTIGSETRRFAVASTGGTVPMLRSTLTSGDPFRQTLAGASEPITIRIGDVPPLVLPPSELIATFLTRCASAEAGVAAAAEAGNVVEANAVEPAANSAAAR